MENPYANCLEKVLVSEGQIRQRVAELGREIADAYAGLDLILVAVLKGAAIFLSDLTRSIPMHHSFDFIGVSSYKNDQSLGDVVITKDVTCDLRGRHILLVEDIYDTGLSLRAIQHMLQPHKPASLEVCAFLYKDRHRSHEIPIKFVGYHIPNAFVVGYGLDYDEKYRNLRCIGVLRKDLYKA